MKQFPFLLLAASSAIASNSLDQRISKLEQQMEETRMCSVYGNAGAKTVSATADLCGYAPFLSLEMLYWQPFIGGSEFAYTNDASSVRNPFNGHIAQMDWEWHLGFRAGMGYRFSAIDWTLGSEFTYFKFHDIEHVNSALSASGLPDVSNETSAESKWAVSFDVLDLYLSRPYFLRTRFSAEPRIGVRAAWIRQRDHAQYFNAASNSSNLLKYVNATTGVGIFGGTQLNWHWSSHWSLFGATKASLIYGKMKVAAKEMNFNDDTIHPLDVSADNYKVLPNISLNTGLECEKTWKYVRFALAASYEFQYWWRQNQRPHLKNLQYYSWIRQAEDLGFHGLNLKAMLEF